MMEIKANTKAGEIVRHNFSAARIFEANTIDFCCGGNVSLDQAAKKEGIDTGNLLAEQNAAMQKEELILFPHICQMEKYRIEGSARTDNIGLASSAINQMEEER